MTVRIDNRDWRAADLGANYSNDTWRLGSYRCDATPGSHAITVRATEKTRTVQGCGEADVIPDGATGWHSVSFRAS